MQQMDPETEEAFSDELFARAEVEAGRRVWSPQLHLGRPTLERVSLDPVCAPDVRDDLIIRALEALSATDGISAWFTRMTHVDALDDDLLAATRRAFTSHGLSLPHFVVMDHDSWLDLITGARRSWYRVRPDRRRYRDVPALRADPDEDLFD